MPLQIMNRWLAIRIDFISNTVVFATAVTVSAVLPVNAGLAGLAITSAINLTDNLSWFVRMVRHATRLLLVVLSSGSSFGCNYFVIIVLCLPCYGTRHCKLRCNACAKACCRPVAGWLTCCGCAHRVLNCCSSSCILLPGMSGGHMKHKQMLLCLPSFAICSDSLWHAASSHHLSKSKCTALQATDLEVNMNAVERMVEYTSQPTEGAAQALTRPPPQSWPHAGAITIDNLQVFFVL